MYNLRNALNDPILPILEHFNIWGHYVPLPPRQAMTKFIRVGEEETGRGDNLQACNSYLWEQSDCKEKYMIKRL